MTILVGGAVLLAVGAAVTLVLGWTSDDAGLVSASLMASGLAALFLVAAARSAPPDDD